MIQKHRTFLQAMHLCWVVGCGLFVGATAKADDHALIVGVNRCNAFRLPDGSKPRPLLGAENDAGMMTALLVEQLGFSRDRVHTVKGDAATYAAVNHEFELARRKLRKNDRFVFYFSGHGTQLLDVKPFDERAQDKLDEALCLADATAEGENLLLDDVLGLWLEDLPAQQLVVILDCCHAGTGIKGEGDDILPRYLPICAGAQVAQNPSDRPWRDLTSTSKSSDQQTIALFACHSDQQAYERLILSRHPPLRMGQFTNFLHEGIATGKADKNSDGRFTTTELTDYVTMRLDSTYNYGREKVDRQHPYAQAPRNDVVVFP